MIANHTNANVEFAISQPEGRVSRHRLSPSNVVPVAVQSQALIGFDAEGTYQRYTLPANSIHCFVQQESRLDLRAVPLPPPQQDQGAQTPNGRGETVAATSTIPVKLLVDDDEPAVRRVWEKRLRERLAKASDIIEKHCRVRFKTVGVDTWISNDEIADFGMSLREFELRVRPAPARLAIGFTSQYRKPKRRAHLGGTRGPLHTHILIREWSQHVSPAERLEALLHELGHFLGATHSPQYDTVMRPMLGDRRSNLRSFRIGFDPLNTFIMYLVGEQLRRGWSASFYRLPADTKAQLHRGYAALSEAMPSDRTAKHYIRILKHSPPVRRQSARRPQPRTQGAEVSADAVSAKPER